MLDAELPCDTSETIMKNWWQVNKALLVIKDELTEDYELTVVWRIKRRGISRP